MVRFGDLCVLVALRALWPVRVPHFLQSFPKKGGLALLLLVSADDWWCAPFPGQCHGRREKLVVVLDSSWNPQAFKHSNAVEVKRVSVRMAARQEWQEHAVETLMDFWKSKCLMLDAWPLPSSNNTGRLAAPYVVDWDGDGTPDLLIGDYNGRVRCPRWLKMVEVCPCMFESYRFQWGTTRNMPMVDTMFTAEMRIPFKRLGWCELNCDKCFSLWHIADILQYLALQRFNNKGACLLTHEALSTDSITQTAWPQWPPGWHTTCPS